MSVSNPSTNLESLAQDIATRVGEQLPQAILELLRSGIDISNEPLQLECSLATLQGRNVAQSQRLRVASLELGGRTEPRTPVSDTPDDSHCEPYTATFAESQSAGTHQSAPPGRELAGAVTARASDNPRPPKRRKATGGLRVSSGQSSDDGTVSRRLGSDTRVFPQRKKRLPDNPALQPSTFDKFVGGVWESIYSGVKLDPTEVIEQWQAIEGNGQPRLLTDAEHELALGEESAMQNMFGRMSVLARKISQTSRTCRSLEVIVQAYWVQCFDDRVDELAVTMSREKAKKSAIAEACMNLNWSEKELRNKMGIWRGYHDIKGAGGWAALVFAGMGLYRFCKYRVSFTDETFQTLKALRHRFEVAADTLHPRWRQLLAIIGGTTERKYTGHPHDWVVGSPSNEAVPLPQTYQQWDKDFSYTHLDTCAIDEDAWGLFDPRTVVPLTSPEAHACQACGEHQSDDPRDNACTCFPNLFGSTKAGFTPVQIFRTPNGKNNGLSACCPFERGAAVGEFVGQVTSGLANLDVMVGETDRATYQIHQGRQGNHTRFVNHSCQPNTQYERFVWLGMQRIVLVSKGIEAGEEITVDYSDTYWKVSQHYGGRRMCYARLTRSRTLTKSACAVSPRAAIEAGKITCLHQSQADFCSTGAKGCSPSSLLPVWHSAHLPAT